MYIYLKRKIYRSIFTHWKPKTPLNINTFRRIKGFNFNFGPQHPASHGVLRLMMQLNGEVVDRIDTHIGLLHRGSEKLMENKNYLQALPYFDRFDYVSMMTQEHAYCLAIETLLNSLESSANYTKVRVLFDELTRLLNHLLAIACHSLDVGSMSPLFWAFEEREKILEFYERVSGARMHAAFYRPNDLSVSYLSSQLLIDILLFVKECFKTLVEINNVLTYNKIWKKRLVQIGVLSYKSAKLWGATGVMARSAGLATDIRCSFNETYSNYKYLDFNSYLGTSGDSYDRFLLRMQEMLESLNIINQVISNFNIIKIKTKDKTDDKSIYIFDKNYFSVGNINNPYKVNNFNKRTKFNDMERLINHFKYYTEGIIVPNGFTYRGIEAPKGEFGVTLVSDGTNQPYRCKVRTPALHHLQLLTTLSKGHMFADMVTLIGSIDIVFGEIDR